MNNIELENKIKEIISIENYFDKIIAMNNFESEYKKSDFFKNTKKSLNEVVKEASLHYALQLTNLSNKIQTMINNLDFSNLNKLLDQIGEVFGQENSEMKDILNSFKDLQ